MDHKLMELIFFFLVIEGSILPVSFKEISYLWTETRDFWPKMLECTRLSKLV